MTVLFGVVETHVPKSGHGAPASILGRGIHSHPGGWGRVGSTAKEAATAKACLATSMSSIHAPFKRSCDRSCRSTPYCGTWSSSCRCLPCQAEAGGGSRDRSVPRRLSRPLPRRLQDGEWVQPVPEARGLLHGLLLRLCQHDDGSRALDHRHGRLYERPRYLAE